jgi:Pyruvate/2-oxoacid:ferredoxin oxidoreductase delta subunit
MLSVSLWFVQTMIKHHYTCMRLSACVCFCSLNNLSIQKGHYHWLLRLVAVIKIYPACDDYI